RSRHGCRSPGVEWLERLHLDALHHHAVGLRVAVAYDLHDGALGEGSARGRRELVRREPRAPAGADRHANDPDAAVLVRGLDGPTDDVIDAHAGSTLASIASTRDRSEGASGS